MEIMCLFVTKTTNDVTIAFVIYVKFSINFILQLNLN